jgi:heme-degrading monooxygenase HmoA
MIAFFNIFHVEPADQQRAIDLLTTVTENFVGKAPGFISSTLHRSSDGTKVAMYARWRSQADYDAMRRDPAPLAALDELMTIARFEPGQYEVVRDFAGAES